MPLVEQNELKYSLSISSSESSVDIWIVGRLICTISFKEVSVAVLESVTKVLDQVSLR
ncbi:MAG: hypothetical protein K6F66_03140 [Pseudobutyrivibrio sp.]|nr:hypothetical protein [Pseudobutyrivibrio sp.]